MVNSVYVDISDNDYVLSLDLIRASIDNGAQPQKSEGQRQSPTSTILTSTGDSPIDAIWLASVQ
eukprot:228049-Amphidinium_carterae.1